MRCDVRLHRRNSQIIIKQNQALFTLNTRGRCEFSINQFKNIKAMKKYIFNVFAAGVLATQAIGMGYNQDEALMDACLNLSVSDYPEDEISDVVLDHVEFGEDNL